MSHAYTLAEVRIRVSDINDTDSQFSFLEQWTTRNSLLDIIGFPEEGKAHFAARADALYYQKFDEQRCLECKEYRRED